MGNIETVLASAIAAVFFAAFIVAGAMWYGCAPHPLNFWSTRFQWDQSYFKTEINRRVQSAMDDGATRQEAYESFRSLPSMTMSATVLPKVVCSV